RPRLQRAAGQAGCRGRGLEGETHRPGRAGDGLEGARPVTEMEMESDRPMAPEAVTEDEQLDRTLRPRSLADYVGQEPVRNNLGILLEAARRRGEPVEHVL